MIILIATCAIAVLAAVALYAGITWRFKYFVRQKVPGPTPKFPYGNTKDGYEGKCNMVYDIDKIYCEYKGKTSIVGFFMAFTPYYLILDPLLLKQILIQKFKHFRNNDFTTTKEKDPLMGRNPFMVKDDEWKQIRGQTAPAMTSNKLKSVYPLVIASAQNLINFINNEISKSPAVSLDARDISARFTCDVTTSSVFGFDSKAFDPEGSEIYELGKNMMKGISESVQSMFPKKLIPEAEEKRFIELMTEAIQRRLADNTAHDDFLSHIISVKRKNNQNDEEAAGHGWTFYLDASETSGVVALNAFLEIAGDQRVQDKLREEIMENLNDDGNLPFEKINELQYLDQVFYEILRLHPPFMFTNKVCSEEIELATLKDHKVLMKQGSTAMISIHSIHRDPEYYPDPLAFNPERFDPEFGGIKSFRDRCVLLPFGDGPRICVGMKLGIIVIKTLLAEILKNFEVTLNDETPKKLKISASELLNVPDAKVMLNFKAI